MVEVEGRWGPGVVMMMVVEVMLMVVMSKKMMAVAVIGHHLVIVVVVMIRGLRVLMSKMVMRFCSPTNITTLGKDSTPAPTAHTPRIKTPTSSVPNVQRMLAATVSPVAHVILKSN